MHLGVIVMLGLALVACSADAPVPASGPPPSILLVTLDTTRADHTGLETDRVSTPTLEALAARGVVFTQAYTTAPTTLPAHASMLTGLYPSEHGVHENARYLGEEHVVLAARLRERGYRTAAFVSGLPLSRQFGLSRGFDHYDDDLGDAAERRAGATTDRALAYLERSASPLFLWVHYFDPHEPYDPPPPFDAHDDPYLGEIAYMDRELGRLVAAFEHRFPESKILVVGDHGEGLGDHGEARHGNLLYQSVVRVPLIVAGAGIETGRRDAPVSVRRVFDTVAGWAGLESSHDLVNGPSETVLAEAMKPYLQYGWQPQVMAVRGTTKVIRSGEIEIYDLRDDPGESRNLAGEKELDGELQRSIRAYPVPAAADPVELSREDREKLASLGYVDGPAAAAPRTGAPNPRDMTHLFGALDAGSGLFVRGEYEKAIDVFTEILDQDPGNLMVCLRLAVAHSLLGREEAALDHFERARAIAPDSVDVDHYLAMHFFRVGRWDEAAPLLESVLERMPERLPARESLARIHEREGSQRMAMADTAGAIRAFERARELRPETFGHHLELGVLYLADGRLEAARDSLDRVADDHPGRPMALFKRAQVSVLLGEPDRRERVRRAHREADAATRPLIENERLFRGLLAGSG